MSTVVYDYVSQMKTQPTGISDFVRLGHSALGRMLSATAISVPRGG